MDDMSEREIDAAYNTAMDLVDDIRMGLEVLYDAATVSRTESQIVVERLREVFALLHG
jgi:hypothetical protein